MARDPESIARMFGRIVPRYDLMNDLMTFGLAAEWRRQAAAQARPAAGEAVLDVCCGTGDLTFALQALCPDCDVVGVDFSAGMVERARQKAAQLPDGAARRPRFRQGDLLDLPFAERSFAAVTVGWGVRNVSDVRSAFVEMARVTRPGGTVICLESTAADGGLHAPLRDAWMRWVVPVLGNIVAGEPEAYRYLQASVRAFPTAESLAGIMASAGLAEVRYRSMCVGAVSLHVGEVPAESRAHVR